MKMRIHRSKASLKQPMKMKQLSLKLQLKKTVQNRGGGIVRIGTDSYTSLEAAIEAASSSDTITLTSDVTIDETLVLNKKVTLDLNQYTITNNSQGEAICVTGDSITVQASENGGITSPNGKQCFVIKGDSDTDTAAVLTVRGGTYDSGEANEAISFDYNAPADCMLTIKNNIVNSKTVHSNIIGGINLDTAIAHKTTAITYSKITSSCERTINAGKSPFSIKTSSTINSKGTYAVYASKGSNVNVCATLNFYGDCGLYADGGNIIMDSNGTYLHIRGADTQYIFDTANGGNISISRGIYYLGNTSNVFAENIGQFISGGTFYGTKETLSTVDEHIIDGSTIKKTYYTAKIGDSFYTPKEAFNAAKDGDTITLIDDASITGSNITVDGKSVTLDLNGHTISAANTTKGNIDVTNGGKLTLTGNGTIKSINTGDLCLIDVKANSEFVMESGTVDAAFENPLTNGRHAVGLWKNSKFTMNGGEIKAGWYCAASNGADGTNAVINIKGGKLVSTMDYAIYAPAINGAVNVTGGTIEGAAGAVAMNRGTLNITGGTLISTNKGDTGSKYSDGTANMHNSVIDFGSKYEGGITASISGGELIGKDGAYIFRLADYDNDSQNSAYYGVNLAITDGTFNANGTDLFKFGDKYDASISNIAISGGTFDADVISYTPDGYIANANGDGTYSVKKSDIKIENTTQVVSTTVTLDGLEDNLKNNHSDLFKDGEQAIFKVETSVPSAAEQKKAEGIAKNDDTAREMYDIKVVKYVGGEAQETVPVKNQPVTLTLGTPVKAGTTPIVTHIDGNDSITSIKPVTANGNTVTFVAPAFSAYVVDYEPDTVSDVAENIDVTFENMVIDGKTASFDLVINGADSKVINRFSSSEWTFDLTDGFAYEIEPKPYINIYENTADGTYELNMDGKTYSDATGKSIAIASVKVTGSGDFTFKANSAKIHAAKTSDNIVTDFDSASTAAAGKVNIDAEASGTLTTKKYDLNVNIAFNNAVENNAADYQDMTVTISGGDLIDNLVYKLGSDFENTADTDVTLDYNNGYALKVKNKLSENTAYTVKVEGAGYRTARYTVNMTGAKTLNFWNNVMDNAINVEEGVDAAKNVTFLAGDIVADNQINIYDLSAVVSYFGTDNLVEDHKDYAKYDLNRDGRIDSKDIAYVLVSWGN